MRTRPKPQLVSMWMLDVFCCALGATEGTVRARGEVVLERADLPGVCAEVDAAEGVALSLECATARGERCRLDVVTATAPPPLDVATAALAPGASFFDPINNPRPPVGFLVDRHGAMPWLLGGVLLMALSIAAMAFAPGYWAILLLAVLSGVGNAVIHPADYAILGGSIHPSRIGRAFASDQAVDSAHGELVPSSFGSVARRAARNGRDVARVSTRCARRSARPPGRPTGHTPSRCSCPPSGCGRGRPPPLATGP